MNIKGTGRTHVGMERMLNEDCMLVDNSTGLYIVADGLGGHLAGEVASSLAVDAVAEFIRDRRKLLDRFRQGWSGEDELTQLASRAVSHASRVVHEHALANRECAGMGCTLTVLLVGRRKAAIAHVGDSRLYLERNGRVRRLTSDHTYAWELIRLGIISPTDVAAVQGGSRLTRAIGIDRHVEVDELLIDLKPGDRFVLCSDGLSGYLPQPRLLDELLQSAPLEELPQRMVDFANSAGGHDNITAVVVEVSDVPKSSTPRVSTEGSTVDTQPAAPRYYSDSTPSSWPMS